MLTDDFLFFHMRKNSRKASALFTLELKTLPNEEGKNCELASFTTLRLLLALLNSYRRKLKETFAEELQGSADILLKHVVIYESFFLHKHFSWISSS